MRSPLRFEMVRTCAAMMLALAMAAAAVTAGCRAEGIGPLKCVSDGECGTGFACAAGACVPHGAPPGGGTFAVELVPRSDSNAATTRRTGVIFSDDVTVLSADSKQTVMGTLAPGASLAGASHMVATLQSPIPGYTDLQVDTYAVTTGSPDASFIFKVPTGALNRTATFLLTPLPPRDLAQPPVTVTATLTPTVNLAYSSNYYFITGRLVAPGQLAQAGFVTRAFQNGQLISSVDTTTSEGRFRIAVPVETAYSATGMMTTIELASGGASAPALRFATMPLMLNNHLELGDLTIPPVPATATYRFRVVDPGRQPVAGAVVRVHTDVSFDRSGAIDFTRDGVSDAAGNVDLALLSGTSAVPRPYDIAVLAPPGARIGSTCVTGFQINDQTPTAGGSAIASSLSLPQKATLSGKVLSADLVAVDGVTVAATRDDPTLVCGKAKLVAPVATATTGRDGSFQLMLDPGSYQFDYDPPDGASVPRLTEEGIGVAAGNNGARTVKLLPGTLIKGAVRDAGGAPLPFATVRFLQVACVGQDACYGRNRVGPIKRGETHSDADGSFRVVVPAAP